jgi:hypothetical protein
MHRMTQNMMFQSDTGRDHDGGKIKKKVKKSKKKAQTR